MEKNTQLPKTIKLFSFAKKEVNFYGKYKISNVPRVSDLARNIEDYLNVNLTDATAIVMGAEGKGIRRLIKENCDQIVTIPMSGNIESLNVSVATGIALFESKRQREST